MTTQYFTEHHKSREKTWKEIYDKIIQGLQSWHNNLNQYINSEFPWRTQKLINHIENQIIIHSAYTVTGTTQQVLTWLLKSIVTWISYISFNENIFTELVLYIKKLSKKVVSQKLLPTLQIKILKTATCLRGKDVNRKLFGLFCFTQWM